MTVVIRGGLLAVAMGRALRSSGTDVVIVDVGTPGHTDHDVETIGVWAFPEPMIDPEPDPSQNYLKLDKRRHRRGGKRK